MYQNVLLIAKVQKLSGSGIALHAGDIVIAPQWKGKGTEAKAGVLSDGDLVVARASVESAQVSKQGTPYYRMEIWEIDGLGPNIVPEGAQRADLALIGNLGRDLTLRFTGNGTQVTNMSVATGKPAVWFNVTVWGDQAANAVKYLEKGRQVFVDGRLEVPEVYQERVSVKATARTVRYLGGAPAQARPADDDDKEVIPF